MLKYLPPNSIAQIYDDRPLELADVMRNLVIGENPGYVLEKFIPYINDLIAEMRTYPLDISQILPSDRDIEFFIAWNNVRDYVSQEENIDAFVRRHFHRIYARSRTLPQQIQDVMTQLKAVSTQYTNFIEQYLQQGIRHLIPQRLQEVERGMQQFNLWKQNIRAFFPQTVSHETIEDMIKNQLIQTHHTDALLLDLRAYAVELKRDDMVQYIDAASERLNEMLARIEAASQDIMKYVNSTDIDFYVKGIRALTRTLPPPPQRAVILEDEQ